MPETALFAVAGRPVAHSLSPEIFRLLFAATGLDAVYSRLAADSAREAFETARQIGLRGMNVTSPFKDEMVSLLDRLDPHAKKIGAVNCVALAGSFGPRCMSTKNDISQKPVVEENAGEEKAWPVGPRVESKTTASSQSYRVDPGAPAPAAGYNTDFIGLIGTLSSYGVPPAGRSALILGAGGAARAAAYALISAGALKVILANRSPEKAEATARSLGCDWAALADARSILNDVDICVSCLPFPSSRVLSVSPPDGALIIDAHYASAPDPLERREPGNQRLGAAPHRPDPGKYNPPPALRWLYHQAIPSFEIFTGLKVPGKKATKIWEEFIRNLNLPAPRPKRHIALVGFMGAGKTTVGRHLARLTASDFVDTDETVEAAAGMSIPKIFKFKGESAFRALEKSVIGELAATGGRRKVIAAGGGAVLDAENHRILADHCRVVWLWAPAAAALSRIDAATRPVLDPDRPLESAERILASRIPRYAAAADLIINSGSVGPLAVARRIKDEMDPPL